MFSIIIQWPIERMIVLIAASLGVLRYLRQVRSLNTGELATNALDSLLVLRSILKVAVEICCRIVLKYDSIE